MEQVFLAKIIFLLKEKGVFNTEDLKFLGLHSFLDTEEEKTIEELLCEMFE